MESERDQNSCTRRESRMVRNLAYCANRKCRNRKNAPNSVLHMPTELTAESRKVSDNNATCEHERWMRTEEKYENSKMRNDNSIRLCNYMVWLIGRLTVCVRARWTLKRSAPWFQWIAWLGVWILYCVFTFISLQTLSLPWTVGWLWPQHCPLQTYT